MSWDSGQRWDDGVTYWDRVVAAVRSFARATATFVGSFAQQVAATGGFPRASTTTGSAARQAPVAASSFPRSTDAPAAGIPRQTESD